MITGKTYDSLKFLSQVALPALGTLYFTLASIWNLPAAEQVVGTIVAIDAFLGVMLQLSSNKYSAKERVHGGVMKITEVDDKQVFRLELEDDPVIFENKKEVVFKVDAQKHG